MQAKIINYKAWISETRPDVLNGIYKRQLEQAGFNILDITYHFFEPFGFTALYLLGESHFAIHTFPEENKTYIELSSCNQEKYDAFMAAERAGGREVN